jgi:hypothetical protein
MDVSSLEHRSAALKADHADRRKKIQEKVFLCSLACGTVDPFVGYPVSGSTKQNVWFTNEVLVILLPIR